MIESNLKMTHDSIFFLAFMLSFESIRDTGFTLMNGMFLLIVIIFPIFAAIHLSKNSQRLDDEEFTKEFGSLYVGIKLNRRSTYMYTTVFCVRRFCIVMTLFVLETEISGRIFSLLVILTFYLSYISVCSPNIEP